MAIFMVKDGALYVRDHGYACGYEWVPEQCVIIRPEQFNELRDAVAQTLGFQKLNLKTYTEADRLKTVLRKIYFMLQEEGYHFPSEIMELIAENVDIEDDEEEEC